MNYRRRAHYMEDPADRPFAPGWTVVMPPQIDRTRDHIIVRRYADKPNPVADGWEGLWFRPPATTAVDTLQGMSKAELISWAKSTGVDQLLVEDESTRAFGIL